MYRKYFKGLDIDEGVLNRLQPQKINSKNGKLEFHAVKMLLHFIESNHLSDYIA